jgi:predicted nucleic acid-binding protein
MIKAVLSLYRTKEIDLIDAWIIEFARAKGAKRIYTFDKKHFKDIREIEIISP